MTEWRYTPHGRFRHAVETGETRALCGVQVADADEWRGTGTQDEYEIVDRLGDCTRCRILLMWNNSESLVDTVWRSRDKKRRIRVVGETERHVLVVRCDHTGQPILDAPARRVLKAGDTGISGYERVRMP